MSEFHLQLLHTMLVWNFKGATVELETILVGIPHSSDTYINNIFITENGATISE